VILMVELGDLREGILPTDLPLVVQEVLRMPAIVLVGIGTNLACQSGVVPDAAKMAELSALATELERACSISLPIVSGGNSANLDWAMTCDHPGRVNELRIGEAILLGREPLHRRAIPDLHTDAVSLVAEVIEAKLKPTMPWGDLAQGAFGSTVPAEDRGLAIRAVLALGRQDVDVDGLVPPAGMRIVGSSSDHLIVESSSVAPAVGSDVRFGLTYSALLRAATSPFVARRYLRAGQPVAVAT
jgi:predicted amino acid racemase